MNEKQISYYKRNLINVTYSTKLGYIKAFEKFPYKENWFKNAYTFKTIFKLKKLKFSNEEIENFIGIKLNDFIISPSEIERFYFKYYSDYLALKELNFLETIIKVLNNPHYGNKLKLNNLEKHLLREKLDSLI